MTELHPKPNQRRARGTLRGVVLALVGLAICFFSATEIKADPLLFSNVDALQDNVRVDLFSNPGTTVFGPQVSFLVDITGTVPNGSLQSLRITFTEAGQAPVIQTFGIPAFGVIPPPYSQLFTLTTLGATTQGVMVTLTVDIIGTSPDFIVPGGPNVGQLVDSYTYTFKVAQPVPEPATIMLLGAGLAGFALRTRRSRVISK